MAADRGDTAGQGVERVSGVSEVKVRSIWRRNPPGREVVCVERAWMYSAMGALEESTVRAHPVRGGKPLVAPLEWFREHYTEMEPKQGEPTAAPSPDREPGPILSEES